MELKFFAAIVIAYSLINITLCTGETVEREALVTFAVNQYRKLLSNLTVGRCISETSPLNSYWDTVGPSDRKTGYLPGILWNLYRYTGDSYWRQVATDFLRPIAAFTEFPYLENYAVSFGTAYDITGNTFYADTIIRAANIIVISSLGFIVQGSGGAQTYNLVELECLVRAWNLTGFQSYRDIAVTVLDNALKIYIRGNYTTFTNVLVNMTTGGIIELYTGNSPFRSWGWWSSGHMWLIVGLVDVYRVTRIERFLTEAEKLSDVYINNLPEDYITFNEFYTANLPGYNARDITSESIAAAYFPE